MSTSRNSPFVVVLLCRGDQHLAKYVLEAKEVYDTHGLSTFTFSVDGPEGYDYIVSRAEVLRGQNSENTSLFVVDLEKSRGFIVLSKPTIRAPLQTSTCMVVVDSAMYTRAVVYLEENKIDHQRTNVTCEIPGTQLLIVHFAEEVLQGLLSEIGGVEINGGRVRKVVRIKDDKVLYKYPSP